MIDYKLLEKLCKTNGISGDEKNVQKLILSEIKEHCEKVEIDNLGNIIALKRGQATPNKKLMISAHMDEVGFIVTNITEEGYLKFDAVGGIDKKVIPGKVVQIGPNNIPGVIGIKPVHLDELSHRQDTIEIKDMYIDIGAKNKKEAEEHVALGASVHFSPNFEVNNDIVKAKALDDRVGCYILIDLIKKELPYDAYFTFLVQEEVGLRGATVAAYSVNPDSAIIIDATTADDIPGNGSKNVVCRINEGAVVSFMDRSTIYNKEYYDLAFKIAKENNIKAQPKQAIVGGNDAGAIHKSKGGVKALALSLPCRYLHSEISLISTNDLINVENLTEKLIAEILKEEQ